MAKADFFATVDLVLRRDFVRQQLDPPQPLC
jgi:hypothetical protein